MQPTSPQKCAELYTFERSFQQLGLRIHRIHVGVFGGLALACHGGYTNKCGALKSGSKGQTEL